MLDDSVMRAFQPEFETLALLMNKRVYDVLTLFNKDCSETVTATQHIIMDDFQLTILR